MIAETTVQTEKAAKYLKWLCGHFKLKTPAEYTDVRGQVQFPFGECEMQAHPDRLVIQVRAGDEDSLAKVKYVVGDHLERFARKDAVQVQWIDGV